MRLAVVGGKLQGIEACYLARKAGWEVVLIDRNKEAPARKMSDIFHHVEVSRDKDLNQIFKGVDFVLPALEKDQVLAVLHGWSQESSVPLAFNPAAYAVSSCKTSSNELFRQIGVPYPRPWPGCSFPLIAKTSRGSGSENLHRITDPSGLQKLETYPEVNWVIQEWVEGPSFSLEVIGSNSGIRAFQITELEMDLNYDCKRVITPAALDPAQCDMFSKLALYISKALNLFGIMDIEIILSGKSIKVLEIDARLPSQTPAAVFHSTGINLVELLGNITVYPDTDLNSFYISEQKGVIYEHIRVTSETLQVSGEHIITGYGPLLLVKDFFGADEAITSYYPGSSEWVATLIITGKDRYEAWQHRQEVIKQIMKRCHLSHYLDPYPPEGYPSLLPT